MRKARPLGSYQSRDTVLSRVDARVKLAALILLTIATFAAALPWGLACALAVLAACCALSGVTAAEVARALRPAAVVFIFAFLANALILDGGGDIVIAGAVGLSSAGIVRAIVAIAKIAIIVGLVSVLTATTASRDLSQAIIGGLRPLGRLGVDTAALGMVVSLALRFIPEALDEFDRILGAQRARGARFDGGPVKRLKAYGSVLIPVVIALFRRSDDLTHALRGRCYTGRGMTDLTEPLGARGWFELVVVVLLAALIIWV